MPGSIDAFRALNQCYVVLRCRLRIDSNIAKEDSETKFRVLREKENSALPNPPAFLFGGAAFYSFSLIVLGF